MTDSEKIDFLSFTNRALMESQERLADEVKQLRKVLQLVRRNIPDYLPEYDSDESPSEVVKECSVEIAMGLVKINKALNDLGMVYWNE